MNETNFGTSIGVVAGVSSLTALPLGLIFFGFGRAFDGHYRDGGVMASIVEGWSEGGVSMHLVLLCELGLVLGGAIALFLFARGKPMVWALVPALAVTMMAVGVVGFLRTMSSSVLAVAHANPRDRSFVMYAVAAESLQSIQLAVCFISALFFLHALALALIGATTKPRKPVLLLALGVFGLGLWQFATARVNSMQLGALKGMYGAPADRATVVIASLMEAHDAQRVAHSAMVLVLVAIGLSLATLRATPRSLAGVVGALLVTLAGLGGLRALGRPGAEAEQMMKGPQPTYELLELRATPDELPFPRYSLGTALVHDESGATPGVEEMQSRRAVAVSHPITPDLFHLTLEADVTRESLLAALKRLRAGGVRLVKLYGETRQTPPDGLALPPIFEPVLHQPTSMWIGLLESCPDQGCATVTETGVVFGNEHLDFVDASSFEPTNDQLERGIPIEPKDLSLAKLLACAKAANAKGFPLLLVLPE